MDGRDPNILTPPDPPPAFVSTARALMDAASERRLCLVRHFDGRSRLVEPHRVFKARNGRRLLTCWQVGGFSRGTGPIGWKNLYLEDIYAVCPLDIHFERRTAGQYRPRRERDDAQMELADAA